MPASHNDYWQLLTKYRDARMTQKEWARYFAAFPDCPLVPVVGARADFIRCPDTNIPLYIHENKNGTFSALPPVDSELDSRFDGLTIEDLRLFQLDWPALCQQEARRLGLTGLLRIITGKPWFWRLGELRNANCKYAYYLAAVRSTQEVEEVIVSLSSQSSSRLLVPYLSDKLFHRLTEAKLCFHVMGEGIPSYFPEERDSTLKHPYALSKGLDAWKLRFDGQEAILKHERGLLYVSYLLHNPPEEPMHALDLAVKIPEIYRKQLGLTETIDPVTGEAVIMEKHSRIQEYGFGLDDEKSAKAIWKEQQKWEAVLEDSKATEPEKAEALRLLDEIARFQRQYAQKSKSNADNIVRAVRRAITRLHSNLAEVLDHEGQPHPVIRLFAEHVEKYLLIPSSRYSGTSHSRTRANVAGCFTYEPPSGVTWAD